MAVAVPWPRHTGLPGWLRRCRPTPHTQLAPLCSSQSCGAALGLWREVWGAELFPLAVNRAGALQVCCFSGTPEQRVTLRLWPGPAVFLTFR